MGIRPMRITLDREDIAFLSWCLEDLIEGFKYDGGLDLAEEHMALKERLDKFLREYDLQDGKRGVRRPRTYDTRAA